VGWSEGRLGWSDDRILHSTKTNNLLPVHSLLAQVCDVLKEVAGKGEISELVNNEYDCNSECNPQLHPWSHNEEAPVYMGYWGFSVAEFRYGDEASDENQSEL